MEYEQGEPYYPRGHLPCRQNYVSLRNKKGKISDVTEHVASDKEHPPARPRLFRHEAEGDRRRQDGDFISHGRDDHSNGGFTLYSPMTEIKSDALSGQWVHAQPTGHYSVSNIGKTEEDSILHGHLCSVRSLPRQDVDSFAFSNALKNSGKSRPRHARRLNEGYEYDAGGSAVKNTTTRYGAAQSSNREATRDPKRRLKPHENSWDTEPVCVKTQETYAISSKNGLLRMISPVKRPGPAKQPSPKKSSGQKSYGNSKTPAKKPEQREFAIHDRVPPPTILEDGGLESCQKLNSHPSDTIEQITCMHDNKRVIQEVREFNRVFRDDDQEDGGQSEDDTAREDEDIGREHYNALLKREPRPAPDGIDHPSQFKPGIGVRRGFEGIPERLGDSEKMRSCSVREILSDTKDVLHSRPATIDNYRSDGARAQWTCTKWVDKMTTHVPNATGWTCEVYSATCVNDADVGMATTDQYKSYIDARKNLAARENSLAKIEKLMSHSVEDNEEFEFSSDDELAAAMELEKKKPLNLRRSRLRYENVPNIDCQAPKGELHLNQAMGSDDNKNTGRNKMYDHAIQDDEDEMLKYKPKVFKKKHKHKNANRGGEGKRLFGYKIKGKTLSHENEQHLILTGMPRSEDGPDIRQAINRPVRLSQLPDAFFEQASTEPAKQFNTRLVDNNLCNVPKNAGCNMNETVVWDIHPDGKCKVVSAPGGDEGGKLKVETLQRDQVQSEGTAEVIRKATTESSPSRVTSMFKSAYEKLNPFAYYFGLNKPPKSNVEELFGGEENAAMGGNKAVEVPVTRLFVAEEKDSVFANLKGTVDDYEAYELYKRARKQYEEEQAQRDSEFEIEDIPVDKKPVPEEGSGEKVGRLVDESVQTTETHDNTTAQPISPRADVKSDIKADQHAYYSTTHYIKRSSVGPDQSGPESYAAFSSDEAPVEPRSLKAIVPAQHSPAKRKKSKGRKSSMSLSKASKYSVSDVNIVDNKRASRKRKYRFSRSDSKQTMPSGDQERQNFSHLKSGPYERSPRASSSSGDSISSPRRRINRSLSETFDSPMKCKKLTKSGKVKSPSSGYMRDGGDAEQKKSAKVKVKKNNRPTNQQRGETTFTPQPREIPGKRSRTKSSARKGDHSGTDTDPYSSLNTTELNSSIMRLYEEIHKLKRQLESVDDAFLQATPRSADRCSPESRLVFSSKSTPEMMQRSADVEGSSHFSDSPNPRPTARIVESKCRDCPLKRSDIADNPKTRDIKLMKAQKSDQESQTPRTDSVKKRSQKPLNRSENVETNPSLQPQQSLKCRPDSPDKLRFKSVPQDTISLNKISSPLKMAGPCWGCWKNKHFNSGNKRHAKTKSDMFQTHGPPGSEDAWNKMESDEAASSTRNDDDAWDEKDSDSRENKPEFLGRSDLQSSRDVSVVSSHKNPHGIQFRTSAKDEDSVCSWRSPMETFEESYEPRSSLRDQKENQATRENIERMVDDVHLLWTSASNRTPRDTPLGCSESIPAQNCSSGDTAYAFSNKCSDRGGMTNFRSPSGDTTLASKYSSAEAESYAAPPQLSSDSTPLYADRRSDDRDCSVQAVPSSQHGDNSSRLCSHSEQEDLGRVKQCSNTFGMDDLFKNPPSYACLSHLTQPSNTKHDYCDAYTSSCCPPGALIQQAVGGSPRAAIVHDCSHKVYPNPQASNETLDKIQANKKLSEFFQGKDVKANDSETKVTSNTGYVNRKQLIPQSIVCRKMKLFGSNQEAPLRFYTTSVLKYPGENNNPQRRVTSASKPKNPNFPEKRPRKESPNSYEKGTQVEISDQSDNSFKTAQQSSSKKKKPNSGPMMSISNYEQSAPKVGAPTARGGSSNGTQAPPTNVTQAPPTRQNAKSTGSGTERNVEDGKKQLMKNNEQMALDESRYKPSSGTERYVLQEELKKREKQYAETPYEKIMELIIDKSSHQTQKNSDQKANTSPENPEPTYRIEITKSPTKGAIRKVFEPDESYSEFKERNADEVPTPKSVSHTLCSMEDLPSKVIQATGDDIFHNSNVAAPTYIRKLRSVNDASEQNTQRFEAGASHDRTLRPREKTTSGGRNITLSISGLDQPEHRKLSAGDYSSQTTEEFAAKGIKLEPDKGIKLEYPEQGIQLQVHMYERYKEPQTELNPPRDDCQWDRRYSGECLRNLEDNITSGSFDGKSATNTNRQKPHEAEVKREVFDRMEFIPTKLVKPKSYRIQNIDPLVSVSQTFPHPVADSRVDSKSFGDGGQHVPEARKSRPSELSRDKAFRKCPDHTVNESRPDPLPSASGDEWSLSEASSHDWRRKWCDNITERDESPDTVPAHSKPLRTRLRSHKKHVAHSGCEKTKREPLIPEEVCLQYDTGTANNNSNVTPSSEDDKEKHEESPDMGNKESTRESGNESSSEFISILPQNLSYIAGRKTRRWATNRGRVSPLCNRQSIASLNLVDCVKDIFFQSHRPDIGNAQGETKIHACPPQRTPQSDTSRKLYAESMDGDGTLDYSLSSSSCEEANNGGYIEKRRLGRKVTCESDALGTTPTQCTNYTAKSGSSETHATSQGQGTMKSGARSHVGERYSSETALSDYTGSFGLGVTNSCTSQHKNVCIASELSQCSHLKERNAFIKTSGILTTGDNWEVGEKIPLPFHQAEDSNKIMTHYSDAIKKRSKRNNATESASQPLYTDRYNVSRWNSDYRDVDCEGFPSSDSYRVSPMFSPFSFKSDSDNGRESRLSGGSYYQDPGNNIMSSFEQMMQDKRPCYAEQCGFRTKALLKKSASHDNRSFGGEFKTTPCLGIPQENGIRPEGGVIKLDRCSNENVNDSHNCVSASSEAWVKSESGGNCVDTSLYIIDEDVTMLNGSLSFSDAARALGGRHQEDAAANNSERSGAVSAGEESGSDDEKAGECVKENDDDDDWGRASEGKYDEEREQEAEVKTDERDAEDASDREVNVEESGSFNNDGGSCDSDGSYDSCETCESDGSSDSDGSCCANDDMSSENGGGCGNDDCADDVGCDNGASCDNGTSCTSDGGSDSEGCDSDESCDCKGNDGEAAREDDDDVSAEF